MPRLSVNVSAKNLDFIQRMCAQYGVTQQELIGVMFNPDHFVLLEVQEAELNRLGRDRRTPAHVKKAAEALAALSDEEIAAILEARSREVTQDGREDQG